GKRSELSAKLAAVKTKLDQKLMSIDNTKWQEILERPKLKEVAFVLNEYREKAKDQLPADQEMIINDLAVDGYQGWEQMYDAMDGNMEVVVEEEGEVNTKSVSQAANKITEPNRAVRTHVYGQLAKSWSEQANLFGQTLNHLGGSRLQTSKYRCWEDVLK